MPRRARELGSSLFPFLSVLACVIGTLTLLIASLAIGQVAESLQGANAGADASGRLEARRAELRSLRARLDDGERVAEELAAARAALRARGIDPDQPEADRRLAVETRLRAAAAAAALRRLEGDNEGLAVTAHGLEVALTRDRSQVDDRPVRILPPGSAQPLRPFFVECREAGVRVHRDDLSESFYLARGSLDDVARFRAFLERVGSLRSATVVFLIRPDGVATYEWASRLAGRLFVRNAKLPLPGHGPLEFAL